MEVCTPCSWLVVKGQRAALNTLSPAIGAIPARMPEMLRRIDCLEMATNCGLWVMGCGLWGSLDRGLWVVGVVGVIQMSLYYSIAYSPGLGYEPMSRTMAIGVAILYSTTMLCCNTKQS